MRYLQYSCANGPDHPVKQWFSTFFRLRHPLTPNFFRDTHNLSIVIFFLTINHLIPEVLIFFNYEVSFKTQKNLTPQKQNRSGSKLIHLKTRLIDLKWKQIFYYYKILLFIATHWNILSKTHICRDTQFEKH